MLGAIAAIALVVGGMSAAVSVSDEDQRALSQPREPQAEIQAVTESAIKF